MVGKGKGSFVHKLHHLGGGQAPASEPIHPGKPGGKHATLCQTSPGLRPELLLSCQHRPPGTAGGHWVLPGLSFSPPPPTLGPQAPSVSEPPLATRLPGPGGPAGPGPYVGNVGPEEDGAFSLPPLYISRPDGCVPREPVSSCPRAGVTRQHLTLSPS